MVNPGPAVIGFGEPEGLHAFADAVDLLQLEAKQNFRQFVGCDDDQAVGLLKINAVIHNAGIGYREPRRVETESGVPSIFAINVLAPYGSAYPKTQASA
jgi:NAD(P)-dependent dehydrogenase (short-subunit alcohol dehydrogenase family)